MAPLRGALAGGSDPLRGERVARLKKAGVEIVPDAVFGSERFLELVSGHDFDVLCHHAAEVGDYRSPDFDITGAVTANTRGLRPILARMTARGTRRVVLTGSFFEAGEGTGSQPLVAFSPYAVSKALTAEIARYRCAEAGIPFDKFVIPHPFGPLEQPRLGAYLAKTWRSGGTVEIKTPAYTRDNIPVSLLAVAYAKFVSEGGSQPGRKFNPSGYIEQQGAFVERIAREVAARTALACKVALARQTEFPEPLIRVNTDAASAYVPSWNESAAWDAYAETILSA
jgi:nucleoside-diphosphate-sugar epimerase